MFLHACLWVGGACYVDVCVLCKERDTLSRRLRWCLMKHQWDADTSGYPVVT